MGGRPMMPLIYPLRMIFVRISASAFPRKRTPCGRITALPRAFERADNVQQKSVVAIFPGWHAVFKTLIQIVNRVKAIAPCLIGEGRIGYDEVEGLEILILWLIAAALLKVRIGERIVLPDFGGGVVVQDHVHLSQSGGSVVHFLPVDSHSGL